MINLTYPIEKQNATTMIYHFLKDNAKYENAKNYVRTFFYRIQFMQKRIKDKLVCKDSKVDVLLNYWEKVEFQILTGAAPNTAKGRPKDEAAEEFAMKFHQVPMDVRMAIFTEYTQRCRKIHSIVFWQWRKMFPNSLKYDENQLNEMIDEQITILEKRGKLEHMVD